MNTIFSLEFHPITMIPECYLSAFDFWGLSIQQKDPDPISHFMRVNFCIMITLES